MQRFQSRPTHGPPDKAAAAAAVCYLLAERSVHTKLDAVTSDYSTRPIGPTLVA